MGEYCIFKGLFAKDLNQYFPSLYSFSQTHRLGPLNQIWRALKMLQWGKSRLRSELQHCRKTLTFVLCCSPLVNKQVWNSFVMPLLPLRHCTQTQAFFLIMCISMNVLTLLQISKNNRVSLFLWRFALVLCLLVHKSPVCLIHTMCG